MNSSLYNFCYHLLLIKFKRIMKKIFFALPFMALTQLAFAQIPNPGFENWTNTGTYSTPDGWATLNDASASLNVFTAEKGTPGNPGTSYLKLTSKTAGNTVLNGVAVSGVMNPTTMQPVSGFPYTGQPQSLTGKWQHMIYGSSQGYITAALTRWDAITNSRITVATAHVTLTGMAMSWANFTIPFNYSDSQAPDSCMITLSASGNNPTNLDYLWVDNLAFSGNVASVQSNELQSLQVYPNPFAEQLRFSFESPKSGKATASIFDLSGKLVFSKEMEFLTGKSAYEINGIDLKSGIYLLKVAAFESVVSRLVQVK